MSGTTEKLEKLATAWKKKNLCTVFFDCFKFLKIVKVKIWGYGSLVRDIDKSLRKTLSKFQVNRSSRN